MKVVYYYPFLRNGKYLTKTNCFLNYNSYSLKIVNYQKNSELKEILKRFTQSIVQLLIKTIKLVEPIND